MYLFRRDDRIGGNTVVFPHNDGFFYESYRVRDSRGSARFLKLIRLDWLQSFQRGSDGGPAEAGIAPMLHHRNLCRFHGSGSIEKDGLRLFYIATDYVRCERLSDRLARGNVLTAEELRELMTALLGALGSIHSLERPVIHNAVTAENILLDVDGGFSDLKLAGFSRARFADLSPDPRSWHGQNLYSVAPERFTGGGSVKSDIFSAGALMFRLVFGSMPWETDLAGKTLDEQVRAVSEKRKGPLPVPNVQFIDIDEHMLNAMAMALAPDPDKRFAGAGEFLDALLGKTEVPEMPKVRTETAVNERGNSFRPKKGNGFADVAGMEDIKELMRKKIINVLKNPERAEKFRIQIPNGMLLYGPPGCGKSFIAEKFAEEAGWNYKFVKSSDLASIYIHGSQEMIGALFDEARKNAPMILNFDEFDALVPDRGSTQGAHMAGEVNEFLSQMNSCGKDRVFVIASSNRPDLIDPAVRRKGRLDQMIYIPVPDAAAREGMFRVQMKGRPQEEGIDFGHLASLTENYVAADIAWIVNDAAERAFEERTDITEKMLEDAIGRTRPSVGPDDIRYYESLRDKIEKSAKESAHNPIGFIQK